MPRIGMDFAGSPLGRAYPKAYMKSDATWENFMNPVYPMDFQRAMYVVRYGLLNKVKARPSAAGGPATMGAAGMGVLEVMRQWALDPYMAMMTWQALQDKTRGRAGGGEVEKAIEAVKYAHSVRRGFEPTFSSERSGYPATGEPDSFLRRTTRYAEYRGYRTRQPAFRSYDIGYFDREGALSGIFSMAVGGEQGGAFKIAVDPEKQRQGIGTRLLEEAERHGVDFTKYAGMNSYTPQGRALMLAFLQKKLGRALGGHPDEGGMYIVGEIGKELFVPNRLRHLIPKRVMDQIPHAKGGMQVIGKRPNELFFPPEDGIIVPNRLMDQVIPHAARGKRARKGERLFRETPVGQYEEIEPYDLGALNPLAPVTIPARRTETTPGFSMETMAAPLQRALSPVAAAIMTARAVRPTPAPRPAPAAAAPVEVAGPPAPPPPPAPTPTLGAQQPGETYEQYARRLQEAVMARPMAYTPPPPRATRAAAGGGQTLAELGLTPEDLKGIGSSRGALSLGDVVGRGAGAGEAETAGNEALANLRGTLTEMTSGMSAWQQMMSGRTPRGLIAQISSMMGGRGGMFELQQQARTQARALRGTLAQPEFTPEMATGLQNYIELQAKLPGVRGKEREAIQKQIDGYRNAEGPLGKAVKQTDDLTKTMQKLQPTTAGIVKNLGTIIAATSAYGMAMQAANAVIQPALDGVQRGVADLGNQFLDFSPTVTAVSKGMAETLTQTHGNYQQVLAQLGMGAGMNAGLLANVGGALQTQAYAKAGGTAAGQQQQAVRAAMGAAGAPSGLFGGYGGVLGTQFLASELGGGKGFTEQMGATYGDLVANIAKNQRVATSGVIAMGGRAGGIRADTSQVAAAQKQMAADIKTQSEWITSQTKAAERGAQAMGDAANIVTFEVVPKDSDLAKQAEAAANAAHDSAMAGAAQAGLIMKVNGHIASSTEEYTKAVSQWAAGLTITPPDVWAQGMQRQLTAQLQMTAAQTQRAQALQIPYGVTQQLLVQPLQRPGAAFVPGAARGAPNVAALGVSQGVAATVTAGMSATGRYQQELRTLAQQGFNAQIANIRQNIDKGVAGYYHGGQSGIGAAEAQFRTLYASATNLSTSIANVTANMNALNAEAARASWANQIRLAGRSLQDALGTIRGYTGRGAAGSQFGRLEGAMQKLAFALQAREIATARAVAQFQAPGQTGEERYMQQKEALAKAAIAQQQLTNQQQVYAINIGRAVTDTNAAIGVMTKARDAEINALAAQDRINAAEAVLATKVQSMATLTGQADQNWQTITGAALSGISDFSGALDDGIKAVYKALGYKVTTNPQTGTNTFTQVGNAPFAQQGSSFALKAFTDALGAAGAGGAPTDRKGGKQTGFLGTISSPTSMTVGEAGAETVAVLRNPRTTDIAPQGGGGGPMNFSITINYSGGGSPQDAAALARQVADEVERRMSRKGQMLGLRAPAY
ncbi:MAG TPA: GNAT family N-acetyltransferase [Gaiellaceae bacterium]